MARLVFDVEQVMEQVTHAMEAKEHSGTYGMKNPGPGLLFVHDQGVYLMSNGSPRMKRPDAEGSVVAYAKGCDPDVDAMWYDTAHDLVGGDDFAEFLDAAEIKELHDGLKGNKAKDITGFYISMTARSFTIGFTTKLKKRRLKKGNRYRFEGWRTKLNPDVDIEGVVTSLRPLYIEQDNGLMRTLPDKAKAYAVDA